MLLKIKTTHQPATDLGYLLHKHPDKLQSVELAVGRAHIYYTEADENSCTACLLLDINPVDLVRGGGQQAFLQEHYVNDKPYTSSSFMRTAMVKAFGSAINGICHAKPELVQTPLPLSATIYALRVACDKSYIGRLFEPAGFQFSFETVPLDPVFPDWGESRAVNLTLAKTSTLKEFLSQLYVFMLALDNNRHYRIAQNEIDLLIRRGENWLENHPEKEWITRRFLKNLRSLSNQALARLAGESAWTEAEAMPEKKMSLHQRRLNQAFELLKASGAGSVLDIGCGEGKLLKLLLKAGQFRKIAGMDVSFGEVRKAREYLFLDEASPAMRDRITVFQSSVTYRDERIKGFDAIVLIEVIEHLDEERLPTMARVVFAYAQPQTVVISTPNAEYNVVYESLDAKSFRHDDHRFEWTRKEFADWCGSICLTFGYVVEIFPVGEEMEEVGAPSQMAIFRKK